MKGKVHMNLDLAMFIHIHFKILVINLKIVEFDYK